MAEYFSSNLKYIREKKGLSQSKLAELIGVNQTTIARWEDDNRVPTIDNAVDIANVLKISLPDLLGKDLRFDNGTIAKTFSNSIKIPILGVIKAGTPIEAQQEILDYIDIPEDWTHGGLKYFGLDIKGDSMEPTYNEGDTVIFKYGDIDNVSANHKDCAVMVNGYDATFKRVTITKDGVSLTPLNLNNSDGYVPTFYNKDQVEELPVRIVGIAVEKRTKL